MPPDRRLTALVALGAFLLLTAAAVVVGGARPASHQGIAPTVVQYAGYLCALVGAVLLLEPGHDRTRGAVVLVALAVLVVLDLATGDGSPDVGGGLVRLVGLVTVLVVTVQLATAGAGARRR
jgi:peptidoglycan/LPS O-acetylase OafA/YrhL